MKEKIEKNWDEILNLLENHEAARAYFQNQWTEILVDEYQDINPSQYRLVKALLGDRKSLFVVGDDEKVRLSAWNGITARSRISCIFRIAFSKTSPSTCGRSCGLAT